MSEQELKTALVKAEGKLQTLAGFSAGCLEGIAIRTADKNLKASIAKCIEKIVEIAS